MAFNCKYRRGSGLRALLACVMLAMLLLGTALNAHGQTFAEWFQQKSTQRKYLFQQIAALEVYSLYLKKGYSIAKGGLGSISGNLLNENSLHKTYYKSLEKVNPAVAKDSRVQEIIRWQQDILKLWDGTVHLEGLSVDELKYCSQVKSEVLADCEAILKTLQQVVNDGKLKMSDADRLKLIQRLHDRMQDNFHFATAFSAQARAYAIQRQQGGNDNRFVNGIYGIH